MIKFLNQYVEMMGDMEFALYTGIFVFSFVLLIGLIGKLAGMKGATGTAVKETDLKTAPVPERHIDVKAPNVAEAFLASAEKKSFPVPSPEPQTAGVDGKKESSSSPEKAALNSKKAVEVPAVAGAVNSLEGAMMWDGDSGKKKKGKIPPPPPAAPLRVLPPGYVDPKAPVAKEKDSEKTVVLAPGSNDAALAKGPVETAAPAAGKGLPVSATFPLPMGTRPASAGAVSASHEPEKPAVLANPKSDKTLVSKSSIVDESGEKADEKPGVDFHMYETLVRRIAGLESEIKKDPLYLDPLMRRVSVSERKLDELAEKVKAPGVHRLSAEPTAVVPAGLESEVNVLREKVDRLQKLLEQLAEGPVGGATP
jgi:hypothetical protein